MSKSYSKIRHLQECNQKLEKRYILKEENLFDKIPVDQEVLFDVYQNGQFKGSIAAGVMKTDEYNLYKLAATDKSEFQEFEDGDYQYFLGTLRKKDSNYYLKLRPKK
jgi:hypothetical protein